jgi:hypothetical protein
MLRTLKAELLADATQDVTVMCHILSADDHPVAVEDVHVEHSVTGHPNMTNAPDSTIPVGSRILSLDSGLMIAGASAAVS